MASADDEPYTFEFHGISPTDHATVWIDKYGKFSRKIGADPLRACLNRPRGHCTWCGIKVTGRRQSWCSDDCVEKFKLRCDVGTYRIAAFEASHGRCAMCGIQCRLPFANIEKLRRFYQIFGIHKPWKCDCPACQFKCVQNAEKHPDGEVDHITPVCLGGGLCDLTNLRVLCPECHKTATKAMHDERTRRTNQTSMEAKTRRILQRGSH